MTFLQGLSGVQICIVVALVIASIVLELIMLHWAFRKSPSDAHAMIAEIFSSLKRLYFCSYNLYDVYLTNFFKRYRKFVDWGFCAPVAGMSMLALKDNPTARYVYAHASQEHYEHCWVEFRFRKTWYVLDPCWIDPFIVPRSMFYRKYRPKIIKVCKHTEFWSYPVSEQFYEKMQHPETSWLLAELMLMYNFGEEDQNRLFHPEITTYSPLDADSGRYLHPWLFYYHPDIIFSRRLMHEMMQKPNRTRPTAHRIRAVKWYQRQVKIACDRQLSDSAESPETASSGDAAQNQP